GSSDLILSWQKLKARLPSQLPLGTKSAHKTGPGSRGFMDAGIVWKGDQPLFILTVYTDRVPVALPDGTPGFTAANTLIGPMARPAYDAPGGETPESWPPPARRRSHRPPRGP